MNIAEKELREKELKELKELEQLKIYDMALHERLSILDGEVCIIRVSGGWIYQTNSNDLFVPYDNEFQPL